ncbi:hypothetical protein Fmac_008704 [Flemingia macrophylla]|uniref:Uncharacterized protein n=1 Tax=Flemingia macrophylla TaxID=520843 RepID=A0ABD1MY77_9FABA
MRSRYLTPKDIMQSMPHDAHPIGVLVNTGIKEGTWEAFIADVLSLAKDIIQSLPHDAHPIGVLVNTRVLFLFFILMQTQLSE